MHVIITGAGGGLGTAVAKTFVDAGWTVTGVERQWRGAQSFRAIEADLSKAEGCDAMVAEAVKVAPIDALVHLVGGFGGGSPISEMSDTTWDLMMNINLRVAFLTIRAVLKKMQRGRIVAIGSRAGVETLPNFAAYSVSKAALVALIRNVAEETKNSGITANVVLPSTIDTPANRKAMPNADFSKWVAPESIAKLLLWLASGESGDVSGAVIPIYGRA